MPACHAGDRGFESRQFRHFYKVILPCWEPLAQLVEHLTFNQGVEGSSPSWLTIHELICHGYNDIADVAQR